MLDKSSLQFLLFPYAALGSEKSLSVGSKSKDLTPF